MIQSNGVTEFRSGELINIVWKCYVLGFGHFLFEMRVIRMKIFFGSLLVRIWYYGILVGSFVFDVNLKMDPHE